MLIIEKNTIPKFLCILFFEKHFFWTIPYLKTDKFSVIAVYLSFHGVQRVSVTDFAGNSLVFTLQLAVHKYVHLLSSLEPCSCLYLVWGHFVNQCYMKCMSCFLLASRLRSWTTSTICQRIKKTAVIHGLSWLTLSQCAFLSKVLN